MSSFYSEQELEKLGLKFYGRNVLLSRKASVYNADRISIGDNTRIDDYAILSGNITLGKYIHIAAYSALFAGEEGIFMDDFVNISSRVSFYASNDDYSGETLTNPTIPDKYKNVYYAKVSIGRHTIIGAGSVILPGVNIGTGCSIGALSLVDKDTDSWGIYAGIPCKRIKERSRNLLLLEEKFLAEVNK